MRNVSTETFLMRRWLLLSIYLICIIGLLFRVLYLQVFDKEFLKNHGDARALRELAIPAYRGIITDRNDEPLAISTPINSIWAVPKEVLTDKSKLALLSNSLQIQKEQLLAFLEQRIDRQFVYLKRHVPPIIAKQLMSLDIPGVYLKREYRRYYPSTEITAHVLGFTNIDGTGQEGLELAYNDWLKASPGSKTVVKDMLGNIIETMAVVNKPIDGNKLVLSIDKRIQYLAYRELQSAVNQHGALSGTMIILNAKTGEIITMVGQPSYNPNNKVNLDSAHYRSRALTDVFEPGSTIKPFIIAAALESGLYDLQSTIDTNPGFFELANYSISDYKNYGIIDLLTIIKKSSNVGVSKVALSLEASDIWSVLTNVGFGRVTASGFPGEAHGYLDLHSNWSNIQQATISFGYGLSVTALQLVNSYMAFATDGVIPPVSFLKTTSYHSAQRVFSADAARQVRYMLEAVVQPGGTGQRASIKGYRIAGKTGTVHKNIAGGYSDSRFLSLFVGLVPVSDPQLVAVVIINEPKSEHYGGVIAAPVFSNVMSGALRLLNIPPDDRSTLDQQTIVAKGNVK